LGSAPGLPWPCANISIENKLKTATNKDFAIPGPIPFLKFGAKIGFGRLNSRAKRKKED
jgi:hypothetical protein